MNSFLGAWGEDVYSDLPDFTDGVEFNLQIICTETEFVVFVDGKQMSHSFPYREEIRQARTVAMYEGMDSFPWGKVEGKIY